MGLEEELKGKIVRIESRTLNPNESAHGQIFVYNGRYDGVEVLAGEAVHVLRDGSYFTSFDNRNMVS